MKLDLVRYDLTDRRTIGKLAIDGVFFCYTLEDAVREQKILGQTAIPESTYHVILDESKRFGRKMPHILGVLGYEGVRIHCGNTEADTQGCILVGMSRGVDEIHDSRRAFDGLYSRLELAAAAYDPILLTIRSAVVMGDTEKGKAAGVSG